MNFKDGSRTTGKTEQKRQVNASASAAAQRKLFALSLAACIFYVLFFVALVLATLGLGYRILNHHGDHGLRGLVMMTLATGGFAVMMALSVWEVLTRKAELPRGIDISRQHCETLWKAIDTVALAASVSPPDKIMLLDETNAFAADIPENGLLRKKTRVLGLGFPLLDLLTVEEAAAVITHEFGHFAGKDTLKGNFHYAVMEVMSVFRTSSGFSYMGFVQKIIGFPSILYFLVIRRLNAKVSQAQEYHADALAAELFGRENAASALITLETLGTHMGQEIYRSIGEALKNGEELPTSMLATIDETVRGNVNRAKMESYLVNALSATTDPYATHPCLTDRLTSLGVAAELPAFTTEQSAAKALLWDDFERLRDEVEALISKKFEDLTKTRREEVQETSAIIEAVYPLIDESYSPPEVAKIISLLMERSLKGTGALEKQQDLINRYGDIPSAVCELALGKIGRENAEGAEELLAVFERYPLSCAQSRRFLEALPSDAEHIPNEVLWLKPWLQSETTKKRIKLALEAFHEQWERVSKIRQTPENVPHGLADWHIDMIVREVGKVCESRTIWLTRTELPSELGGIQFRMQVEVAPGSIEKMDYLPNFGPVCCLPGSLACNITEPMNNGDSPVFRKVRDFKGSLIYRKPAVAAQNMQKAA